MKLEKYLAQAGIASRRKSKEIILNGEITVNGKVILEPSYLVSKNDVILFAGQKLEKEEYVYFLLNKPRGVLSSAKDDKGRKTVIDLLEQEDRVNRVFPVGRLDYDSTGALILTNDGELTFILTRPEYQVPKTYLVRIDGALTNSGLKMLTKGIKLSDYQTKPATVAIISKDKSTNSSMVEITIIEGKNRQVKEMFESLGHKVKSLTRLKFDFLTLEGIKRGSYRKLKIHEVKKLYMNEKNKKCWYLIAI